MTWLRQAAEHGADHCKTDEGANGSTLALEIARHAAKTADPGECSLRLPLGQIRRIGCIDAAKVGLRVLCSTAPSFQNGLDIAASIRPGADSPTDR